MAVKLNHTIVHARGKRASAQFSSALFGRVKARGLPYRADPARSKKGEIITRPYGSAA